MHVVTAQFDMQRGIDDYMETRMWRSCAGYIERIGSILDDAKEGWIIGPMTGEDEELVNDLIMSTMLGSKSGKGKMTKVAGGGGMEGAMSAMAAEEKLINPHTVSFMVLYYHLSSKERISLHLINNLLCITFEFRQGEVETEDQHMERLRMERESKMSPEELRTVRVPGSLSLFLSRLDEEYTKSLQRISPHSIDYVMRLRDEVKLVELLTVFQRYFDRVGSWQDAAMLAELRVEHLYYRHDSIVMQVAQATEAAAAAAKDVVENDKEASSSPSQPSTSAANTSDNVSSASNLEQLCTYIYQHGSDRQKTRAMLCHIYHHAIHNRFV
jgi:hypothetical protein